MVYNPFIKTRRDPTGARALGALFFLYYSILYRILNSLDSRTSQTQVHTYVESAKYVQISSQTANTQNLTPFRAYRTFGILL